MIKLYIDFDGVILNTIDTTYKELADNNITEEKYKKEYYENLDWYDLLNNRCSEIKNSINNIKKLIRSNLYDVSILTHIQSENEKEEKIKYINKKINNLKLIPVPVGTNKCDAVDCKNAILVDDYSNNLELWNKKGGIPIKFSDNGKKSNFITITSLDTLIDKYDEIKKYIK